VAVLIVRMVMSPRRSEAGVYVLNCIETATGASCVIEVCPLLLLAFMELRCPCSLVSLSAQVLAGP
jgi:hypothetical protein